MYAASANDYKERILELYDNDGLRYDMGKAGRRLVEAGYDWEKIVGRMEEVLLMVAGKREAL
jgi:glycosyltransferase involved in cell wall biosynthesis